MFIADAKNTNQSRKKLPIVMMETNKRKKVGEMTEHYPVGEYAQ